MMQAFGGDAEKVNKEWLGFRQQAVRMAYTIDEFGEIDISKYDLETVEFDNGQNPDYFSIDRHIEGEVGESYNLAELETHD